MPTSSAAACDRVDAMTGAITRSASPRPNVATDRVRRISVSRTSGTTRRGATRVSRARRLRGDHDTALAGMVRYLVTDLQRPAGLRRRAVGLTSRANDGVTNPVGRAFLDATERRVWHAYETSLNATRAG